MVKFMRKYKKYQLLFSVNLIFISIFMIFIFKCIFKNYDEYSKLNSVYILDNIMEIVVTTKELRQLEKNNCIYLNSKKKKIKILSIVKNILKKDDVCYHQVRVNINNVSRDTILNVSIYNKKERMIRLFFDCWKED